MHTFLYTLVSGEQIIMVFRLLAATILGGIVGYEREMHNRWAGFRTHILVCVGSCLIMMTSVYLSTSYAGPSNADPGRLAAQVVSGIGFLGAGTILHSSSHIRGLTTAANLWMIAGVGLAVGCGLYLPAIVTTVMAFVVLRYLVPLESRFRIKRVEIPWLISLIVQGSESGHSSIFALLDDFDLTVQNVKLDDSPEGTLMEIVVGTNPAFDQSLFLARLRQLDGVREASIVALKADQEK